MTTYNEMAKKYNTTADKIRMAQIEWCCNEGYDGSGNEHETLISWLDTTFGKKTQKEPFEPYQKGDEYGS